MPRRAVRRDLTSSSGNAASSSKSRSARATPSTYSAFLREKPSVISSSSVARATRSRVGNAMASSAGSPNRSIKRLRTANAAWRETCCAVIDDTSASNGSGASGGRKPGKRRTVAARISSPCANAWNVVRSKSRPSNFRATGSIAASSGSAPAPPGAGVMRTSRPATTRCKPPSCQTFARSTPQYVKRSSERSKSYGCGTAITPMAETLAAATGVAGARGERGVPPPSLGAASATAVVVAGLRLAVAAVIVGDGRRCARGRNERASDREARDHHARVGIAVDLPRSVGQLDRDGLRPHERDAGHDALGAALTLEHKVVLGRTVRDRQPIGAGAKGLHDLAGLRQLDREPRPDGTPKRGRAGAPAEARRDDDEGDG